MAGLLTLNARQGSVFRRRITVPWDLTGHAIRMQVRQRPESASALISVDLDDGITLESADTESSVFLIEVPATTMAAVPASYTDGWHYDLELVPDEDEARAYALLAGRFHVAAEITRPEPDDG